MLLFPHLHVRVNGEASFHGMVHVTRCCYMPTCVLRNATEIGTKSFAEYLVTLVEYINLGPSQSGCTLLILLFVVGASFQVSLKGTQ